MRLSPRILAILWESMMPVPLLETSVSLGAGDLETLRKLNADLLGALRKHLDAWGAEKEQLIQSLPFTDSRFTESELSAARLFKAGDLIDRSRPFPCPSCGNPEMTNQTQTLFCESCGCCLTALAVLLLRGVPLDQAVKMLASKGGS